MSFGSFAVPSQAVNFSKGALQAKIASQRKVSSGPRAQPTGGPHRFQGWYTNPKITAGLQPKPMRDENRLMQELEDMHEYDFLFNLRINSPDHSERCVLLTSWQLNMLLRALHRLGLEKFAEYRDQSDDKRTIDMYTEHELYMIGSMDNNAHEPIKFLTVRYFVEKISFPGVQWTNTFLRPENGPGITLVTGGRATGRAIAINDVSEQDSLYFMMRRRERFGPVSVVLQSFGQKTGPNAQEARYDDWNGGDAYGPSLRVGVVAKKEQPIEDAEDREILAGLKESASVIAWKVVRAPTIEVQLSSAGLFAYKM